MIKANMVDTKHMDLNGLSAATRENLRVCLRSSNKDGDEGKSKNLSRDGEFTFTIFTKSVEFVESAK